MARSFGGARLLSTRGRREGSHAAPCRGKDPSVIGGVSYGELGFASILVAIVLLAQIAPRIGEAIGARYEKRHPRNPGTGP